MLGRAQSKPKVLKVSCAISKLLTLNLSRRKMQNAILILAVLIISNTAIAKEKISTDFYITGSHSTASKLSSSAIGIQANWKKLSFYISHGRKTRGTYNEPYGGKEWQSSTNLGIEYYPIKYGNHHLTFSWSHTSDIFRKTNDEPINDFFGFGTSYKAKQYNFKLLFGLEGIDCRLRYFSQFCFTKPSFLTELRYYF